MDAPAVLHDPSNRLRSGHPIIQLHISLSKCTCISMVCCVYIYGLNRVILQINLSCFRHGLHVCEYVTHISNFDDAPSGLKYLSLDTIHPFSFDLFFPQDIYIYSKVCHISDQYVLCHTYKWTIFINYKLID